MSRIDDLIAHHCPGGVESRAIGSVIRLNFGTRITKRENAGTAYPVYGGGGESFRTDDFNRDTETVVARFAMSETCVRRVSGRFWMLDSGFTFEPVMDGVLKDFVTYVLLNMQPQIYACASQSAQKNLRTELFKEFKIPMPPIEVQREIVAVLDTFAELESELEAELAARRAQYAVHAAALLRVGPGTDMVPLGTVAAITRGASPRPIQSFVTGEPEGVPWIKIGDVSPTDKYIRRTRQFVTPDGAKRSRRIQPGDFVLSNSMSFGRPYISKIDGCIHDGWLAISDFADHFDPDYLYYLLRSEPVQSEFERRAGSGTVRNLNADIVRSVMVPAISKGQQREVAEVLDAFDSLVNDLSVGLPAELAARRKQYEHYRDRLLTFEEAS